MTKGIILAGGTGSRLGLLTKITNKHLLPVGPAMMIFYPLAQLISNGILEICIVSGLHHLGSVVSLLGSGSNLMCEFTYKVQDKAGGIAEALDLCRKFAENDPVAVFLGDNIFGNVLDLSLGDGNDAMLFLKQVPDPHRFGIAEVDHMKRLVDVEEKPESPKSNLAVTGAYVYSPLVWEAIGNIGRSSRGELEISDVNRWLLRNGCVSTREVSGWWSDAGTQESYRKANAEVWSNMDDRLSKLLNRMMKS